MPLHSVAQRELVLLWELPHQHYPEFQQVVCLLDNGLFRLLHRKPDLKKKSRLRRKSKKEKEKKFKTAKC